MNKNMIKIDNSKQIYYSINEGLFRLDENNKPYYQTVIIVPIISIMEEIKAAEIQIFGSTKDWFTPERITIESESRKLTKDEFLKIFAIPTQSQHLVTESITRVYNNKRK